MNWFYVLNGERMGPVSEEELKNLVSSGELSLDAFVWCDGMDEWESYSSVFDIEERPPTPSTSVEDSPPAPGISVEQTPLGSGSGTGGQTPNKALRARARQALSGQWGPAVGVSFVFIILQQAGGIIPFLGIIIALVISGPLMLGLYEYFLRVNRGAGPEFSHLFSGFSNFVLGLGIYFLMLLIYLVVVFVVAIPGATMMIVVAVQTGEGSVEQNPIFWVGAGLIAIPYLISGIYVYLLFALAYFVAVDEPEKGSVHALKESIAIVKGYKGKLCMMLLVFFGWSLLTIFTLFIGMLWVLPYMYTSLAAFYDDLKEGQSTAAA